MTDKLTKEQRSWNMSQVHSRDTGPELIVRKYLFSRGLRFRVNAKYLPGHPDIVLRKYKALIEVRGCFWHRHPGCKIATMPQSNVPFWTEKFTRNVARDKRHEKEWAALGWRLFVVWECELVPSRRNDTLANLYAGITGGGGFTYAEPDTGDDDLPAAAEEADSAYGVKSVTSGGLRH